MLIILEKLVKYPNIIVVAKGYELVVLPWIRRELYLMRHLLLFNVTDIDLYFPKIFLVCVSVISKLNHINEGKSGFIISIKICKSYFENINQNQCNSRCILCASHFLWCVIKWGYKSKIHFANKYFAGCKCIILHPVTTRAHKHFGRQRRMICTKRSVR